MSARARIGARAAERRGWLRAHRYLLARRISQTAVLALFGLGPWAGVWLVKGNLASSRTLDVLDLSDPFVLAQTLAAGHRPALAALGGALIVIGFYALVGGRAYCAWVCPVNPVTDAAAWLRRRLGLRATVRLDAGARYWMLAMTLVVAAATGIAAWELVNPVSILFRGVVFGMGAAWAAVLAVFLFDLAVAGRGWCGHLCPMGAFYSVIGLASAVRIRADRRDACNDCAECYAVCPEPQVIKPALKGGARGIGPVVVAPACTNCGRCIDVCSESVFRFGLRFPATAPEAGVRARPPVPPERGPELVTGERERLL